jgi:hypothetical protein
MVYTSTELWGDLLIDRHFAQLNSTVSNAIEDLKRVIVKVMTGKKIKGHQYAVKDFILLDKPMKRKKTSKEMLQQVVLINALLGGKDLRKNK